MSLTNDSMAHQTPDSDGQAQHAIAAVINELKTLPGALLPILHGIQNRLGYIPDAAITTIASQLNLSRAEVHGTVSFYHYFRSTPPGRHIIYLCRAEACQAMDCQFLQHYVKSRLGIDFHETTENGMFTLEPVYCLGNCACSPALMIDQELHGRVSNARFDEIISACEVQG